MTARAAPRRWRPESGGWRPWSNPVLVREVRQRMRGGRAAVILTCYLGLLLAAMLAAYVALAPDVSSGGAGAIAAQSGRVGRGMFGWLVLLMTGMLLVLVPAMAGGSIASERERQTLIPLLLTPLSAVRIITGKVSASALFVVLLLVASIPLLAVPVLVGGVSVVEALRALVVLVVLTLVWALLGVCCSAIMGRSSSAILVALGLMLVLVLLTPLVSVAVTAAVRGDDGSRPGWPSRLMWVNPVVGVADAMGGGGEGAPSGGLGAASSPLDGLRSSVRTASRGRSATDRLAPTGPGDVVEIFVADSGGGGQPIWMVCLLFHLVLGAALMWGAGRRLALPGEGDR